MIFTAWANWANSVSKSQCPSVFVCVPLDGDFQSIGPLGRYFHSIDVSVCVSLCLSDCDLVHLQGFYSIPLNWGLEDWGIGGLRDWGIRGLKVWGIGGLGD